MTLTEKKPLSSMSLRLMALVFMFFDHAWFALVKPAMPWMTCVGRLAMPIFAFLISEGSFHTSSFKKYALRLFAFGLISEIPFNLFTMSNFWNPSHQNVMFTLLLGLLSLRVLLWAKERRSVLRISCAMACFLAAYLGAELLCLDYRGMGVTMVVMFGLTRNLPRKTLWQSCCLLVICACISGRMMRFGPWTVSIQYFALLSMIPIFLYSGRKGSYGKLLQYGAYWFYPVHLGALAVLRYIF